MKTAIIQRYCVAWTNVRTPGRVYYSPRRYRWEWEAKLVAGLSGLASVLHPRECRHYFVLPMSQIKLGP